MNRLSNGLVMCALLMGIQQAASADECMDAWRKSSAAKSCGSASSAGQTIEKSGQQCKVETYCSTSVSTNSYPNNGTYSMEDIVRLENINGRLRIK